MVIVPLSVTTKCISWAVTISSEYFFVLVCFFKNIHFRATELWKLDGNGFSTEMVEPILDDYKAYPELFLIEDGSCT